MSGLSRTVVGFLTLVVGVFSGFSGGNAALAQEAPVPDPEVVISVPDQRMSVIRNGATVATFPISTSRFGLGDAMRSYRTPLGHFRISGKVGGNLPKGAVLKGRRFTGEILPPNAPGRDPIVTRILQLQGLEPHNRRAEQRGIYIHGTPEERNIGRPVSYGCIRMRSQDVVSLYQQVTVGTRVLITMQTSRTITRTLARRAGGQRQMAAAHSRQTQQERREVADSSGGEKKQSPFSLEWKF